MLKRYIIYTIKTLINDLRIQADDNIRGITTTYVFGIHPSEWPENYNPEDEDDVPPTMFLPLSIFIEFHTKYQIINNKEPWYSISVTNKIFNLYKKNDIYVAFDPLFKKHQKEIEASLKDLLYLEFIIKYYNKANIENMILKRIKIIIYVLYLICWLYILIISIHTLNLENLLLFIEHFKYNIEPFTEQVKKEIDQYETK